MEDTYTPEAIEKYIAELKNNPAITVTKVVDTGRAVVVYVSTCGPTGFYNGPFAYLPKAEQEV